MTPGSTFEAVLKEVGANLAGGVSEDAVAVTCGGSDRRLSSSFRRLAALTFDFTVTVPTAESAAAQTALSSVTPASAQSILATAVANAGAAITLTVDAAAITAMQASVVVTDITCGDGLLSASREGCDDGNNVSEDGCSSSCQTEDGWLCDQAQACAPVCGDGLRVGNETDTGRCDDNNNMSGDGCSSSCEIEEGWRCSGAGQSCEPVCGDGLRVGSENSTGRCDDNNTRSGDGCDRACNLEQGWYCDELPCRTICGDSLVGSPAETCDDGNNMSDDGCSDSCETEVGWICPGESFACYPICGDALIRGNESEDGRCDDGNRADGDGCSSDCTVETGWNCSAGSACKPVCGDGFKIGGELDLGHCDDGNTVAGDGCDSNCTAEHGWYCEGMPCQTKCGDGLMGSPVETCDDGNNASDDGCNENCSIELGWSCPVEGEPCAPVCGDGLIRGNENETAHCDDGNLRNGDGCNSQCMTEHGWYCIGHQKCFHLCGDGDIAHPNESCDDNNSDGGDGCNITCHVEPGWVCGEDTPCHPICGDNLIRGDETCDDGNLDDMDGCSSSCVTEHGWYCGEGFDCYTICGDLMIAAPNETCDDGNQDEGDGCDANCSTETGWYCAELTPCWTVCGDGVQGVPREECEDGNREPMDGCDAQCRLERGRCQTQASGLCFGSWVAKTDVPDWFFCVGQHCTLAECCSKPVYDSQLSRSLAFQGAGGRVEGYHCPVDGFGVCGPVCGDGLREGAEKDDGRCDDGNMVAGDGCDSACNVEPGWYCLQEGQPCITICGDRAIGSPQEDCDDGNNVSLDGCSSNCRLELGLCKLQSESLCVGAYAPRSDLPDKRFCKAIQCTVAECCAIATDSTACEEAGGTCAEGGAWGSGWEPPPTDLCNTYRCPSGWSKIEGATSPLCDQVDAIWLNYCLASNCCEPQGASCACSEKVTGMDCCSAPFLVPKLIDGEIIAGVDFKLQGPVSLPPKAGMGQGMPRYYYHVNSGLITMEQVRSAFSPALSRTYGRAVPGDAFAMILRGFAARLPSASQLEDFFNSGEPLPHAPHGLDASGRWHLWASSPTAGRRQAVVTVKRAAATAAGRRPSTYMAPTEHQKQIFVEVFEAFFVTHRADRLERRILQDGMPCCFSDVTGRLGFVLANVPAAALGATFYALSADAARAGGEFTIFMQVPATVLLVAVHDKRRGRQIRQLASDVESGFKELGWEEVPASTFRLKPWDVPMGCWQKHFAAGERVEVPHRSGMHGAVAIRSRVDG
eukprot:TRINITY_DN6311_c0_g1_i3.p1 TRINITY_DN6311_c0_g1~~TRINITY_DN6311_c0_g1_i3.p1  ORF type:complete len:1445 (-),score=248.69 TRINITY_DN6311_c0_g1_i3:151-3921(-)